MRNVKRNAKAVVLIVDDCPVQRLLASCLLSSMGCETLIAQDADEAICILAARDDIDLVFTDVQMPGTMDGVGLCQYIRNRWPSVKLIVASGLEILDESSLPIGSRFFLKPYDMEAVSDTIARMLPSGAARLHA